MTLKEEKEGKETNEGALEEECWKVSMKDRKMGRILWCRGRAREYAIDAVRYMYHA